MAEAKSLVQQPKPSKDKVAAAVKRAIDLAGGAAKLQEHGEKLWPTLEAIGSWLGKYAAILINRARNGLS